MTLPLAERLRIATRELHHAAERAGPMPALLRGELPRAGYVVLLGNLHRLYDALERGLARHAGHPQLAPLLLPGLARAAALAADLQALHGPDWAQALGPCAASQAYARHLDELADARPALLAAHAYVRYLGDLHGGQLLARRVAAGLGLGPLAGPGLAFYDFGDAARVAGLIAAFRAGLDAIAPDEAAAQALVDEALATWRSTRNMALALTALLSAALLAAAGIFAVGVRRLEERNAALRESEARAQAANQAKTDFLAAISHELRTPLTSIRGFAELMELRLKEEKFREQAGLIRKASEHLNDLLTEILDLVKVEAGAMQVGRTPVPLRPLVEGTARFFAITAAEKQLQLPTRLPADGHEVMVLGDELRLKQILNNLLSNAFKFTERGSVAIEVDRDGERVRVHVTDTGPGIPPELHEVIFERFRQGGRRVSYQHGGTGLGLALSRAMAELMGGTLTVQSRVGEGSRFTLSLPAA